jgi:hypothetical protein
MSNSDKLIALYDKLKGIMTTKTTTVESYDDITGLIGIVLPIGSSLVVSDSITVLIGNDSTDMVITEIANGIAYGSYGIGYVILPGDIIEITYQAMTVYSYPIDARDGRYPLVEVRMTSSDVRQRTAGSSYAISVEYELMIAVESGKDEEAKRQAMINLLAIVDKVSEFTKVTNIDFSVGVMLNSEVIVGQINITV